MFESAIKVHLFSRPTDVVCLYLKVFLALVLAEQKSSRNGLHLINTLIELESHWSFWETSESIDHAAL